MDNVLKVLHPELLPNQELIKVLKEILLEAEKGELRSAVGVGIYNNKDITHYASLDKHTKNDYYALIGNLYVMMATLEKSKGLVESNLVDPDD